MWNSFPHVYHSSQASGRKDRNWEIKSVTKPIAAVRPTFLRALRYVQRWHLQHWQEVVSIKTLISVFQWFYTCKQVNCGSSCWLNCSQQVKHMIHHNKHRCGFCYCRWDTCCDIIDRGVTKCSTDSAQVNTSDLKPFWKHFMKCLVIRNSLKVACWVLYTNLFTGLGLVH